MKQRFTIVSGKGQMVIPAPRQALGIEAGTRVAIRQEGTRLILEPETVANRLRLIKEMRGCSAGLPSGTEMLLEERRLARERESAEEDW